jgi:hypothetical protein
MAVRLSTSRSSLPLPPRRFLVLISVRVCIDPRGHSAAGRIRSIKTFSDPIKNRTCILPGCSIVPQPTTLPRVPWTTKNLTLTYSVSNTALHCYNSATNEMSSRKISKISQHNVMFFLCLLKIIHFTFDLKRIVFWDLTPNILLEIYRRFPSSVTSKPTRAESRACFVYSSSRKMKAVDLSWASVAFCWTTWRNIPKYCNLHSHRCEKFMSRYLYEMKIILVETRRSGNN